MGLFSRKKEASPAVEKKDLISCEKVIISPPKEYGSPKPMPKITKEQDEAYRKLLTYFSDPKYELAVNTKDTSKRRALSPREKFWLTRECILRFLRAAKWHEENAIKNLEETMAWRREVGITYDSDENPLRGDTVAIENETGKEVLLGFDLDRRPLFYMKNGRQNTEPSFRQVQQLIYMMECVIALTPEGVEQITVLVDFKAYKEPGIISDKPPPLAITKLCIKVLQDYFPERLAKCILINIPWFVWAFLKMSYPFLDPRTREKAIFDEPFEKHVELTQLEAMYGGKLDFKYNHKVYWADLGKQCDTIRERQFGRFNKFGSVIGLSEWDLKGSNDEIRYPVDYASIT
ncbi:hypothetical protein TBLA_0A05550 [Henningerozyma blattae CBS 6284]|uniref:SEC14 homolog 3 n=1 Tax=Henningerozyma blattae (strain ATCC 34711 / CBS 6284 / DSM 70876 / NBRC 10599 / NRRL Y-10934 / UCD 77-7) TaxID=1071380 RepID=I2GW46_HENB6|nr:hypothetical protein TBLA_0A05550 [Tetrapisispora blattae CBS 6284]CCH58348.1 hypothetical protein TBLA_0A05550 [Tetrapisispora blattae CBS 6284]